MRSNASWTDAVIDSFEDLTPTVREFRIRLPGNERAQRHEPGSHLQVQLLVNSKPQLRSYSLVGEPDGRMYRIAVKRLDDGRGGSRAMWQLVAGDRLQVNGPHNHFPLDFNAPAYLLVAGGIGITPLLGMAQALAARCAQSGRPLRMLYGARGEAELAYGETLRACLGERLQALAGSRIDFAAEIAALPAGAQMYVCGPVPMLDAARHAWEAAGRPATDLRYETFGNSGRFAPQAFRVRIPRHSLDIMVPAGCSLLDALEQAGVEAVSDCKRGECGLCTLDVLALDGEIDHRDVFLSEHEKQGNTRLCACVSRVVGSVTLDSSYRPDA
ncbi:PDR/VanB family oxidoreductase [Polaromonas sp. YR568]|uniref:PDR/VanB family oxidoreductase n=1 Tax=Polaromonas sp. YR568 TaxID=1855301 RepID=UPI00398C13FE